MTGGGAEADDESDNAKGDDYGNDADDAFFKQMSVHIFSLVMRY
jgi:hypothetical protein